MKKKKKKTIGKYKQFIGCPILKIVRNKRFRKKKPELKGFLLEMTKYSTGWVCTVFVIGV